MSDAASAWVEALIERHGSALTRSELLRAIRALSTRYVQRRASLASRSPIDSAGKKAAFAVFYAPLHFFTVQGILDRLGAEGRSVARVLDLGCGTGVASAAWALAEKGRPVITGVDRERWLLDEAVWNWRHLGLVGRTIQTDLTRLRGPAARAIHAGPASGIVLGWAVNELPADGRAALLTQLREAVRQGASLLVVEPLARSAVPWWDDWVRACQALGGRADEWRLDLQLPSALAALDDEAGFDRQMIGARSIWVAGLEG